MSTPTVTLEVTERFYALRRKYLAFRIAIASAVAIAILLITWMLLSILDYFFELPLLWRQIGMSASIASVSVWYFSRLVVIFKDAREKQFAGLLERSFDGFGQRIRTVLDTAKGRISGPEEMLAALGHQTMGRWETLSPQQLVPVRGLLTSAAIGIAVILLTGGLYFRGGDWEIAMQRALGKQLPYTTFSVEPGDRRVLEGLSVNLSLVLSGRTNRDVVLKYRFLEPENNSEPPSVVVDDPTPFEWTESELLPSPPEVGTSPQSRRALFEAALGKAIRPIEYQFVTSVGATEIYRIDVQPLIEVKQVETLIRPPSYTRLEQRTFTSRDVSALQNSIVTVSIQTNHPLGEVNLLIGPKPSKLEPVEIQPGTDRSLWTFSLPSNASSHWEFSGNGLDGTPMTPVKGRLRIRYDQAPKISWRDPANEIKVHTLAEVPMSVQISDDYGLSESGVIFQLGDDEDFVLKDWREDAEGTATANTTRLLLEEILPLESLRLTEKDFISYYAYAIDNREGRLQRSESEMRYIDIRPLRQYFAEIERDSNQGDGGRSLRVSLDELISRQRFLINKTRRLTRSTATNLAGQLGTIDRMVENQSELAGLVRLLTEFLISEGNDDVEALNQAEAAMLQASDSLAAGSFDLALVQENDALLALAEARETLDLFLIKNPTPQQQRELARFARNLMQKLRRERPETEREIADNLKQIARQQMQLGRMAARMQNPEGQTGSQGGNKGLSKSGAGQTAETTTPDQSATNATNSENPTQPRSDSEKSEQEKTGEKPGDSESPMEESDQPSVAEPEEEIYAKQVELMERLEALSEQLSERLSESKLMARRMEAARQGINDLTNDARERQFEKFPGESLDVADQLLELGLQLEALQELEAVSRISNIRDMTVSLANLENELSEKLSQNPPAGNEPAGSESTGRTAKRIKDRTETIEDVLQVPVESGDVETSEVNEELRKFVEESRFLEQLGNAREVAGEIAENEEKTMSPRAGEEAFERAVGFAEASQRLDELYQELVTPRLTTLRDMENKVNVLVWKMSEGQGGENEDDSEVGVAELKEDLKEEGLKELAELLDPATVTDEQIEEMFREMAGSESSEGGSQGFGAKNRRKVMTKRALVLVKKLRDRIQETILLEISADRDAPIPVEYRRLVDGYFRTIAGEEETLDSGRTE